MILTENIVKDFKNGRMEEFYSAVYPCLITYAARILGDDFSFLAEDCVQDVIYKMYENRENFSSCSHFKSFLYLSIRNNAINYLRKSNSRQKFMSMQREESEDLQASLILQETLETIFDAIDRLPPKYHRIFELSFEQGMSIPEIAKLLDISESGVKRQKRRMIDMLKASLSDESLAMMLCIFQSTAMA